MNRRIGIVGVVGVALGAVVVGVGGPGRAGTVVTVQGEKAVQGNIKTAADQRASGGAYLALDTAQDPPRGGWFAEYRVDVPDAGVYRVDAVLSAPAMADREPLGGSQFGVSVNGGPVWQVARSEPRWTETKAVWGALVDARLDDVELRKGANTVRFVVDERQVSVPPTRYGFSLDVFTVRPTALALKDVFIGDPDTNLGVYRGGHADLRFRLNGRTPKALAVSYSVTDYFGKKAASGTTTVPAGASTATVKLSGLRPGSYRAMASAPGSTGVGYFARLPERKAVVGKANRFGVTGPIPWLVPSAKLNAFAAAMKQAGAGYVRDEISWPAVEQKRGTYDPGAIARTAKVFKKHGIDTLGAWWTLTGNTKAPTWAMAKDSEPLPADLRDAYNMAAQMARHSKSQALELWNEPDVDVTALSASRIRGDQQAAYLKAAALGVADQPRRPFIAMTGIAFPGEMEGLMLQNGVMRYADIWSFHGYGEDYKPGRLSPLPWQPPVEHELKNAYGARTQMWMTESGIFIPIKPKTGHTLTGSQQTDQARFLVQSAVSDLATGTDKHFWFTGAPYCADGYACFGLLNENFQPWPSYSAHAAMTSILGRANFAGKVKGLPKNVSAYTFSDGNRAITVLWADRPTKVEVKGPKGRVYDIMGRPAAGAATTKVTASPDPVYLVTKGRDKRTTVPPRATRPSIAEHIVVSQRFPAATRTVPPLPGYELGKSTRFSVDVYNFNGTPQTVALKPRTAGGWTIRPGGATSVRVPAMGRTTVWFTLEAAKVKPGKDTQLIFEAFVGKGVVPWSISQIHLEKG